MTPLLGLLQYVVSTSGVAHIIIKLSTMTHPWICLQTILMIIVAVSGVPCRCCLKKKHAIPDTVQNIPELPTNQPYQIALPFPGTFFSQPSSLTSLASPATVKPTPPEQLLLPQQSSSPVANQQNYGSSLDPHVQYSSFFSQHQPIIHQQVVIEESHPSSKTFLKTTDELHEDEKKRSFRSYDAEEVDTPFDTSIKPMDGDRDENASTTPVFGSTNPLEERDLDQADVMNLTVPDHQTTAPVEKYSQSTNSIHELALLAYGKELLQVPLTYEGSNDMVLLEEINWPPTLHSIPHDMFPPDKSSGLVADVDDELKEDSDNLPTAKELKPEEVDLTYKIDGLESDGRHNHTIESTIGEEGQNSDNDSTNTFLSHINAEQYDTSNDETYKPTTAEGVENTSTRVSYEGPSEEYSQPHTTRKQFPNHSSKSSRRISCESKDSPECLQKIKQNARVIADMLISKARNVMNKLEIGQ